jgi:ribonuclease HI
MIIYTDASIRSDQPIIGGWGWVALNDDAQEVASASGCLRPGAHLPIHQAECVAILQALHFLQDTSRRKVDIRSDEPTLVSLLTDPDRGVALNPLRLRVRALLRELDARLVYVPRQHNHLAHMLCRQAVRAYVARQPGYRTRPQSPLTEAGQVWHRLEQLARDLGQPKTTLLAGLLEYAPLLSEEARP